MFAGFSKSFRRCDTGSVALCLRRSGPGRNLSTAKPKTKDAGKASAPGSKAETGAMKLSVFRSLWGVLHSSDGWMTLEEAVPKVQQLGFDGVECPILVPLEYGKEKFRDLLAKHNLKYIPMLFTDGPVAPGAPHFNGKFKGHPAPAPGPEAHAAVLQAQFEEALWFNPEKINSHTGNDYMTVKEARKLFESAIAIEKAAGGSVKLMHETHRKRFLHSPWVVRDFVPKYFPDLKLVADLSHFTCVAETNPLDPNLTAVIKLIAPNVHHIHGRIGYDHGPQVNDPRAPEWAEYVEGFEKWWQIIWAAQAKAGMQVTTLSPEHGPPNYQHTIPYTRQPLANIWDINTWVQQRVLKLFATRAHLKGSTKSKQ